MKLFRSLCTIALGSTLLMTACKKGDTGPAGAAGPAGTANVIYSPWMATTPWVGSTTSTGTGKATYYFNIAATGVTQSILDNGTVLVYAKFIGDPDTNGIVKQLPSTYYNLGGASTEYRFQTGLTLGKIKVICDIIPTGVPSTSNQVRYVIIPGGTATTAKLPAPPDYSKMSYREVCSLYHIPE